MDSRRGAPNNEIKIWGDSGDLGARILTTRNCALGKKTAPGSSKKRIIGEISKHMAKMQRKSKILFHNKKKTGKWKNILLVGKRN